MKFILCLHYMTNSSFWEIAAWMRERIAVVDGAPGLMLIETELVIFVKDTLAVKYRNISYWDYI